MLWWQVAEAAGRQEVQQLHKQGVPVPAAPSKRYLLMIGAILGAALLMILTLFIIGIVWVTRLIMKGG